METELSFLESRHNKNVTGFGLSHPTFGKIFIGRFDPIHKSPTAHSQMLPIFNEYDIIAGDTNAGWHRLIKSNRYSRKPLISSSRTCYVYNPISYLAPVQPTNPRDARLDMVMCKYEQPIPIDVGVTFEDFHLHKTPRHLMQALGFPSNHRPIKTSITIAQKTMILAFWNVSDPIYWSQFCPLNNDCDPIKEHERLVLILKWVDNLAENCDVFGLAEVPARLVPELQTIAQKHGFTMAHQEEHSNVWRPNNPVSQMVIMY